MSLKSLASEAVSIADIASASVASEVEEYNRKSVQYHHFCTWLVTPITGAMLRYGGEKSEDYIPLRRLCDAWEEFKRAEGALEGVLW